MALAVGFAPRRLPPGPVAVFPAPRSRYNRPTSHITFRGVPAGQLGVRTPGAAVPLRCQWWSNQIRSSQYAVIVRLLTGAVGLMLDTLHATVSDRGSRFDGEVG